MAASPDIPAGRVVAIPLLLIHGWPGSPADFLAMITPLTSPVHRPTGVAVFPTADFAIRRFADRAHNITHWSEFDSGGHFPALGLPDLLIGDIRAFFGSLAG